MLDGLHGSAFFMRLFRGCKGGNFVEWEVSGPFVRPVQDGIIIG